MIEDEIHLLIKRAAWHKSEYESWKNTAAEALEGAKRDVESAEKYAKENKDALDKIIAELGRLLNPIPTPVIKVPEPPVVTEESEQVGRQA